jgi:[ribosomal protein S18]-alanine N-acetyltransferase
VRFQLREMEQEDAEAVAGWRYPEPFSFYDWSADEDDLAELLSPAQRRDTYFAVDDEAGDLVGHFSFKWKEAGLLEIGLGLRPDLTGRGLGVAFVEAGLEHGRARFRPEEFSLAVAAFNGRAITVYERVGFSRVRTYVHRTAGADWEFVEMRRPA